MLLSLQYATVVERPVDHTMFTAPPEKWWLQAKMSPLWPLRFQWAPAHVYVDFKGEKGLFGREPSQKSRLVLMYLTYKQQNEPKDCANRCKSPCWLEIQPITKQTLP